MTDHESTQSSQPAADAQGAEIGIRFVARLIDHVILSIALFVIIVPLIIGAMFSDFDSNPLTSSFSLGSIVSGVVAAAIVIGYFAYLESSRGQTIGKMLLKLRTVGPDGGNPTFEQAVKRNLWYALGIFPILGGLAQLAAAVYIAMTVSNSTTNQGWHDEFAATTRVVKTT